VGAQAGDGVVDGAGRASDRAHSLD
jgi:hypothetical protein